MLYLKLIEITVIIVIITDLSGFTDHLKKWITAWLSKGKFITKDFTLKIIDCSFCQNWWVSLVYIICTGNFSIFNVMFILLCSFFTSNIAGFLLLIKDFLATIETKLSKINIIK